ncbi:MAG TPA: tRNA (adenosine(37)-N6)-threonylcarbamoyltransferase complex ATPase subunit type 1 TsaE [Jatrophihabitantaceae bacterium]|nr:tRNA (adenosine(37)-N6)-threonylcarbamoyltransferase complex ATPase subunit type 1 TsaE [Jatrophihabitantaceae bacterium]
MTIVATTTAADETQNLGAAIAELVRPGDLLLLAGELGAGKTALVQGLGRGLGVTEPIISPTFMLARQHDTGRLVLHHIDVYRLEQMHEVFDVGLPELLDEGGVTVIEWGDVIAPTLPADFLEVRLRFGEGDDDRILEVTAVGPRWNARTRALTQALSPWTKEG